MRKRGTGRTEENVPSSAMMAKQPWSSSSSAAAVVWSGMMTSRAADILTVFLAAAATGEARARARAGGSASARPLASSSIARRGDPAVTHGTPRGTGGSEEEEEVVVVVS
jgi:hypothetical protein